MDFNMGTKDYIGGGIFVVLGVFIWAMTLQFPVLDDNHPGPSLFPRVLGTLFIVFGGMVLYSGWKSKVKKTKEETSPEKEQIILNYFNPILVIILIAAFIALANKFGFIITGVAILFTLMMKLRVSLLKNSMVSILLVCFIYFIFSKVLRVPLPIGLLGW
jgi:putative tricarboxylic transport membrane protein